MVNEVSFVLFVLLMAELNFKFCEPNFCVNRSSFRDNNPAIEAFDWLDGIEISLFLTENDGFGLVRTISVSITPV